MYCVGRPEVHGSGHACAAAGLLLEVLWSVSHLEHEGICLH